MEQYEKTLLNLPIGYSRKKKNNYKNKRYCGLRGSKHCFYVWLCFGVTSMLWVEDGTQHLWGKAKKGRENDTIHNSKLS
ncbi:hypothetical protein NQ317_005237 [Molorchus minor]|uniref:Uncharacterized protein n=1 Tax=Molorchus minor TaxID=1323400 RepID=A0ABQ9JSR0_9CUCU|nr:hypothetical protein NQ317_005237 [Molorchus minor]